MKLTNETIQTVAATLGAVLDQNGDETVLRIASGGGTPGILVTVNMSSPDRAILSAQTVHGYFELHNAGRCVIVEPDEVIFVAEEGERISGVIIGRNGVCSSFANVDRSILSADFTTLHPALLLAAMQLGLAEQVPV